MTQTVRRAGGFALVGALSLAAPFLGRAAVVPFAIVAGLAAFVIDDGPLFELFARSGDREEGTLYGLAGFALAAAGLALFASLFAMPTFVFVASVLVLSGGTLAAAVAQERRGTPIAGVVGFVIGGTLAGAAGQLIVGLTAPAPSPALGIFYAASGALLGALVRAVLFERDDPLVLFSTGLLLWLLAELSPSVPATGIGLALAVTAGFGYLAYALDTASIPGMLTGVLSGLLMIVLGGFGWFALLIAFFAGGGLATKFKYERKRQRGIAEDDGGARGSGNVLANAAVALAAVLGYAAAPLVPIGGELFRFVFAGSIAAASVARKFTVRLLNSRLPSEPLPRSIPVASSLPGSRLSSRRSSNSAPRRLSTTIPAMPAAAMIAAPVGVISKTRTASPATTTAPPSPARTPSHVTPPSVPGGTGLSVVMSLGVS